MTNLTKMVLGSVSMIGLFATAAHADDAPAGILGPDFSLSAGVAVQSDYRFRGISQGARQIAPQATLTITGPDGWYGTLWTSKTDWGVTRPDGGTNNPSFELDEYIGKHTDLWGTDLNIEAYYYSYPDYNAGKGLGLPKASYFEAITQLTHTFGPLTLTGTWAYSPEFAVGGGTGNYLEGTAAYAVNDWLTVSGNVGHQWVQAAKFYLNNGSDGDYTHYDIGATAVYKSLSLDVRYVGTNMNALTCSFYIGHPADHPCAGGFVATVSYTFNPFP